jgi:cholesterol transport system auxiliary component
MRSAAAACLLTACLAACALPPAAEPPLTSSLLDELPAAVPRRAQLQGSLLVFPPEGRPLVDTTQMAYSLRPHHIAYFARNQWAERPTQMLQPLLVRTLEATGAFSAVLTAPYAGSYALALRTEIVDLVQDFSQQPPVLRLGLRARLSDDATGRTLGTREIALREPMRQQAPQAGVEAANHALARALAELAGFVLDQAP